MHTIGSYITNHWQGNSALPSCKLKVTVTLAYSLVYLLLHCANMLNNNKSLVKMPSGASLNRQLPHTCTHWTYVQCQNEIESKQ